MIKRLLIMIVMALGLIAGCGRISTPSSPSPSAVTGIVPTPSSTNQEAPTNLPAFSTGNANLVLKAFVQGNGDCRLPCVLGLSPGLTDQATAESFVRYFADASTGITQLSDNTEIYTSTEHIDRGGVRFMFWEGDKHVQIGVGYLLDQGKIVRVQVFGEAYQQGEDWAKKIYGDPLFDDVLGGFAVTNILRAYGVPEQIWIRPFPDEDGHPSPPAQYTFNFVLVYPEDGFLIEYIAERTQQNEDYVGCPTKAYSLHISTWDPKSPVTLSEAVQGFSSVDGASPYNVDYFRPIGDVTSLNVMGFYEIFSHPDSGECVQTQRSLWTTPIP